MSAADSSGERRTGRIWLLDLSVAVAGACALAVLQFYGGFVARLTQRHGVVGLAILVLITALATVLLRSLWRPLAFVGAGRRSQVAVLLAALIALVPYAVGEVLGPLCSKALVHPDAAALIRSTRWISYEPRQFSPYSVTQPTLESMELELEWIRRAGYEGITTFSSIGSIAAIPRLAKAKGLAVIMGVWNPADRIEVKTAVSQQRYVDAYAVGHNGLRDGRLYNYAQLVRAMEYIRFHTWRPVSTTEPIGDYTSDARLLTIGDWLFPDASLALRDAPGGDRFRADPQHDADELVGKALELTSHRGDENSQPVLLKLVAYPVAGATAASQSAQAAFFRRIIRAQRDGRLPGISIAPHGAFDASWKTDPRAFRPWDRHTGLLDAGGLPRPATKEMAREWLQ